MGRVTDAFAASWRVAGFANYVAVDSTSMLTEVIDATVSSLDRSLCDSAAYTTLYDQIRSGFSPAFVYQPPSAVATAVERVVHAVATKVLIDTTYALAAMAELSRWSTALAVIPKTQMAVYTPTRLRQVDNRAAMTALVRRSAALAAAARLLTIARIGPQDALTLRDAVVAMFAPVIADASTINDGAVSSLRAVLTASVTLLTDRIGPVNTLAYYSTASTLPLHVAAHRIYQDAREAVRLLRANPAPHPSFMPTELVAPPLV
jgi:hypothetical protein